VKHSYELWISMVTRMELEAAGEPKRSRFLQLIEDVYLLELVDEIQDLADKYISAGIVPDRYLGDAFHLSYVTYYKIDYLVTWNCSHFANVTKRRKIKLFNTSAGLFVPEIVTPEFFMED
ncbi:MAG: type II toxin-antitoxin system VapC family toxin, partial [Planctomycetota bacterium]|nr:type II toxin-antitoxin system VapC family toxin [Planctomycetota bacterium]